MTGKNLLIKSQDDVSERMLFLSLNQLAQEKPSCSQFSRVETSRSEHENLAPEEAVILSYPANTFVKGHKMVIGTVAGEPESFITLVDFSESPLIEMVDLGQYNGKPGCPIRIVVGEKCRVSEVWVSIRSIDGSIGESGNATCSDAGHDWIYTTRNSINYAPGRTIHIYMSGITGLS